MTRRQPSIVEIADRKLRIVKALQAAPYAKTKDIVAALNLENPNGCVSIENVREVQLALVYHLNCNREKLMDDYHKSLLTRLPLDQRAAIIADIAENSRNNRTRLKAIEDADKLNRLREDKIETNLTGPVTLNVVYEDLKQVKDE